MPQTPAQAQAAAQARAIGSATGQVQARALQSPAVQRSQYLADLLTRTQEAPTIQSGGELGARLLAQGIAQWGKNRADKAVTEENTARTNSQREAAGAALARLLGGEAPSAAPQPETPPVQSIAPEGPGNTLTPVEAPTAPIAPIQGAELPPVGQMPQPAPQQAQAAPAPQQQPNPLGPTPGEASIIQRQLASGDPAQIAEAQAQIAAIEQRMAAPPDYEITMVNGVPFRADPHTGQSTPLFAGGLPPEAMNRDEFNPNGTRQGTLGQRDPFNRLTVIEKPPEGFEAAGDRLQPIAGGPQDQSTGGNQISNERNLRSEYQGATQEYRNVRQAFEKVQASLAEGTGIGDVGGIFGVMKIFDPGSTVREGEAATVQNSGGVPEQVRGLYNRVVTGERLTPQQRQEIMSVGRAQFSTYEQGYQDRTADYIGMAEGYGLDPSNIVGTQRPQGAPARQGPRTPPAVSGSNGNVLRQRFGTPDAQARARELLRQRQGQQ